jgi:molecular chaperone GrpE
MDRQTRAQQRAAAIDVSPARLAAEIERLTRERDLARRQAELAREELVRVTLAGGAPGAADVSGASGPSRASGARSASSAGASGEAAQRPGSGGPFRGRDAKAVKAIEELSQERDDYLAALQRERAEFTNYKRRTAEEREAMLGLAAEGLIRKVLAVADDFDLAVEHRPDDGGTDGGWVEGIVAIDRKLRQLLESEGVTGIDAAPGTRFDPREHEAVANVPGTGRPGGEIVDELRRGYRLRDRVIRPALVAVAEETVDHASGDAASNGPQATESTEHIH